MVAVESSLVEQGIKRAEAAERAAMAEEQPWFKRQKISGSFPSVPSTVPPTTATSTTSNLVLPPSSSFPVAPPMNPPTMGVPAPMEKEKDFAEILLSLRRSSAPSIFPGLVASVTIEELPSKPNESGPVVTASKTISPSYYSTSENNDRPSSSVFSNNHQHNRRHSEPNISSSLLHKKGFPGLSTSPSSASLLADAAAAMAQKMKIRHKRCSNACTEHKRKHQRCPLECPGRKKEMEHQNQFTKMGALVGASLPAQLSQLHVSGVTISEQAASQIITPVKTSQMGPQVALPSAVITPVHPEIVKHDPVDISNLLTRFLKYEGLNPEGGHTKKPELILS